MKEKPFPITCTFKNGAVRHYSSDVLGSWLLDDPNLYEIVRDDTGEIIFYD